MKVIFLDIDGVLNSYQSAHYWKQKSEDSFYTFCPIAIAMLNWVMENTDASIVIESAWGYRHSLNEIQHYLEINGFKYCERIIDITPRKMSSEKCHEIGWYLKVHPEVDKFVIIDNENISPELDEHLVKTDDRYGFTYTDAVRVINMLEDIDIHEVMYF